MKRRRRHDHVDRLGEFEVEVEVEHILAPDLRPVAQPGPRQSHHVLGGVDRQHAASGHQRQQRFGDPAGPAAHVKNRRVLREPPNRARTSEPHACCGSLETSYV
jgi:hypothetical protein